MIQNQEKGNLRDSILIFIKGSNLKGLIYLFFLIIFGGAEILIDQYIGLFPSEMQTYILSSNRSKFKTSLIYFVGKVLLISIDISIKLWLADRLTIVYRQNIVQSIHKYYLRENAFYDILMYDIQIDNPDARITNDVMSYAKSMSIVITGCIQIPILIIWYTILVKKYVDSNSILINYGFSLITICFTLIFMIPVIRSTYNFEKKDGDFRLAHVSVKENAESICLSKGQSREKMILTERLHELLDSQIHLANRSFFLNFFSQFFPYLGGIIPYFCLYLFFKTKGTSMTPAEISSYILEASFYIIELTYGLTSIFNIFREFSSLCGYATRISELWKIIEEHKKLVLDSPPSNSIELFEANISKPNGDVLIQHLTFSVLNESLFITGPSGCGKSSIFRVLGRLWPLNEGKVLTPSPDPHTLLILTQRPYIPVGSFKECCTFPLNVNEVDPTELIDAISFMKLDKLLLRNPINWVEGISPGERQRIALIRVLLHKPRFVLLDEATSAIPMDLEAQIFEKFTQLRITMITIAHNQSLKRFHQNILEIFDDGDYTITPVNCN